MYVEFDRNQKPEKKRYLQLHKQGRSHAIAISLNTKPNAKHANSCALQSRKLAPSTVGLQKNFPEIVSADEKKSRYNTTITELTNETKTTGRQTCSLPKQREETTTKYSTPASMPTVSSPQKPPHPSKRLEKKKKKNQPLKKKNLRKKKTLMLRYKFFHYRSQHSCVRAKGERNEVGREERERRDAHKGEHMRKTVTLEYRPGTCTDSGAAEKTRAGQNAVYLVVVPSGVGKGAGERKAQGKGGNEGRSGGRG
jgi:hypothetical protein